MLKKIFAIVAMLYASIAFAAVDVNKATAAELDSIKGIGPGISTKILDERKKGNFKDWNDFIERVKGVGDGNAAKFSSEGMTVNGAGFKGAAPAAKADAKPAATPAPAAAPAPAAKEEKKDPKAEAKMKADDAKKAKAEEAKAKKEAAAKAKEDAKKPKADAPKDAASAPKK